MGRRRLAFQVVQRAVYTEASAIHGMHIIILEMDMSAHFGMAAAVATWAIQQHLIEPYHHLLDGQVQWGLHDALQGAVCILYCDLSFRTHCVFSLFDHKVELSHRQLADVVERRASQECVICEGKEDVPMHGDHCMAYFYGAKLCKKHILGILELGCEPCMATMLPLPDGMQLSVKVYPK